MPIKIIEKNYYQSSLNVNKMLEMTIWSSYKKKWVVQNIYKHGQNCKNRSLLGLFEWVFSWGRNLVTIVLLAFDFPTHDEGLRGHLFRVFVPSHFRNEMKMLFVWTWKLISFKKWDWKKKISCFIINPSTHWHFKHISYNNIFILKIFLSSALSNFKIS